MNVNFINTANLRTNFSTKRNVVSAEQQHYLIGVEWNFNLLILNAVRSSQHVQCSDDVSTAEKLVAGLVDQRNFERPLPTLGFLSTNDVSCSAHPYTTFDVENFFKLAFSRFSEGALLNDFSGEVFDQLAFFQFVIDAFV